MAEAWAPWANNAAQDFSGKYSGSAQSPRMVLLHTTEGNSWPSYGGGATAPHLTALIDRASKSIIWRQHFPFNRSARALANKPGGVETNTAGVIQIELVGTSGWATSRNLRASYQLGEEWYVPGYPDWFWQELGRAVAWFNRQYGIPLTAISDTFPAWNGGSARMSFQQWNSFSGLCGHSHAPENDHSDPGSIPAGLIIKYAKQFISGNSETQKEGDLKVTVEEFLNAPLGGSGLKVGVAMERAAWLSEILKRELPQAMVDQWLGASGPSVGVALQSTYAAVASLTGRLDGLLKALESLATGQGVDLAAVEAAAKRGAQSALENAAVEVKLGGENAG